MPPTLPVTVEEMQGLYGPFTIAERVVQKIWLRRDFDHDKARTLDGRDLVVGSSGIWNLLDGPDFRQARLTIGSETIVGDVEVHFHSSDWHAHRHAEDGNYDNVILHVVLLPPEAGERRAVHRDGREIPTLVLLPLLLRGLEEYASDDALEKMTARDTMEKIADLAAMPAGALRECLHTHARRRWQSKCDFAKRRIERLGWPDAAHHAALEILGYRRNRVPMLAIATRHPLAEWTPGINVAEIHQEQATAWNKVGMRPASQPMARLDQYARWTKARPVWPAALESVGAEIAWLCPASDESVTEFRKRVRMDHWRTRFAIEVMANEAAGSRRDTLVCDGFLPLLACRTFGDPFPLWFHWFLGDVPDEIRKALAALGLGAARTSPFCHGWAQGFLGWISEREAHASP